MIATDLIRALTMLGLPLVAAVGAGRAVALVLVVVFVESAAAQLFLAARAALVPSLVPTEELPAANQLASVVESVLRIAGPPLGGLLLGLVGVGVLGVLDSASYVVSAVTIVAIGAVAAPEGVATEAPSEAGVLVRAWRAFLA